MTDENKEMIKSAAKGRLKNNCTCGILLVSFLIISVILNVVFGMLWQKASVPCPSCPHGWVGYEGRCYFFSEAEGSWDFSQRNCSSYHASLATIDTQQEKNFIMRHKGSDHWFGLRRKGEKQPWKWSNGSIFNDWFKIGADGLCAYLNDEEASSTWCETERNWICSKSLSIP